MTTCSSSSDDPGFTSTSDVDDEDSGHFATNEVSFGLVQESIDELSRSLTKLKTGVSHSDGDLVVSHTGSCDNMQHGIDTEPECNGRPVVAEVGDKPEVKGISSCCCTEPASEKLEESIITCPANGLVSVIPALSSGYCVASSEVQPSSSAVKSDECKDSVTTAMSASKPASSAASSASATINSEPKPSPATNSIPLLSIPQPDHSCGDDSSFSILPSLSSFLAEDAAVQVTPPLVFSVPCTRGKESDSFTDVNLDDDVERPRSSNSLRVQPVLSAESSRDSSPNHLQVAASLSSLHLDDAIVQSILCDDDSSHTVGSARHSTSVAFAANTDSAAFRTPASTAAHDVPLKEDGLHVVEPDSASFEEISLQSSQSSMTWEYNREPDSADTAQTATSASLPQHRQQRSGLANFFAR